MSVIFVIYPSAIVYQNYGPPVPRLLLDGNIAPRITDADHLSRAPLMLLSRGAKGFSPATVT